MIQKRSASALSLVLLAAALTACGTPDVAPPDPVDVGPGGGVTGPLSSCDELLSKAVQPKLAFCRSCHVPDGVADVAEGRRFMLSPDPAADMVNLRQSWTALGGNNPVSRILLMASGTDTRSHTGGSPWKPGSAEYTNMAALLAGFADPAACVAESGGVTPDLPLLGSKRARHVWQAFCEGDGTAAHPVQPDSAALPPDPRSLVRPGVNQGRAVFFNAYWEDCHANAPEAEQQAKTCGEYRARRDRGLDFLMNELPASAISAQQHNDTWKKWGLDARPADFDALYTLRYGLNRAPFDNPYPIPTASGALEDPNATDGGSGQLPLGLRQMKDASGRWTGQIGSAACFQCHGGQIGDPAAGDEEVIKMAHLGLGNNNFDVPMSAQDGSQFSGTPVGPVLPGVDVNSLFNVGIKQRGQNNAVGAFEVLVTVLDLDSLGFAPNPAKFLVTDKPEDAAHPLAHTQDTPPWWNMGSRPRKFFDAGVSNDSTRIIMAAGPGEFSLLFTADGRPYRDRIEQYDQDLEAFFLSLSSPAYPFGYCTGSDGSAAGADAPECINPKLAEQGAILFHSKDLWAANLDNPVPRPAGGNGSCASCHGAYSPRYVADDRYLQDRALEGVAGHISTLDVIGTDRARSDMLTPTLRQGWGTTYWGYPEGVPGYVAPEDKDPFTEAADDMAVPLRPVGLCEWQQAVIGYQAPPLYGTWATAPYFHNGSVPTLEQVLDSGSRHAIWRRQLQTEGPVTGFDQRLSAYDFSALGWKHEALACTDIPGTEQLNCNPVSDEGPSLSQMMVNFLGGLGYPGVFNMTDPAQGAIDKRLVYDTRILGNANTGHRFSDVLTDAERRALLEYLKTL